MASPSSPSFALTDGILFTGDVFVEDHALLVDEGHVLDIVPNDKVPANLEAISCKGRILAPGFIDCQVNGGGGVMVNESPSCDSVLQIAAAHAKTGTTRLLPTIMSSAVETLHAGLQAIREAEKKSPAILGAHLEGPHINAGSKGAHDEAFIRPLLEEDIAFYKPEEGETLLVTLAPEQVSPEQVERLAAQGVVVALGHTAAEPDALRACLSAGARGFTHLYDAMGPMSARRPGPAGVALDDPASWCSIIMDGRHVVPEMLRLALRAKPENKLFLVSDAVAQAGVDGPVPPELLAQPLSGAVITLGEIVTRCIHELKLDPHLVLRMAAAIPAAFLGIDNRLGYLLPKYEADIVALDLNFKPQEAWCAGRKA